jgi:malonyl-CoA O-methyltransferase
MNGEGVPKRGLFVSGTDTGIGKTIVSALLLAALRRAELAPGYFKPVQTGDDPDSETVARLGAARDGEIRPPVYALPLPASPDRAAAAAGVTIRLEAIEEAWRALPDRAWVVEGAGGLLVPLDRQRTMRDLVAALGLPLLVVASTRLGTINHTLLTLEAARARGLRVAGLVLNGPADPGLAGVLARFDAAPVVAELRPFETLDAAAIEGTAARLFPAGTLRRLFDIS